MLAAGDVEQKVQMSTRVGWNGGDGVQKLGELKPAWELEQDADRQHNLGRAQSQKHGLLGKCG